MASSTVDHPQRHGGDAGQAERDLPYRKRLYQGCRFGVRRPQHDARPQRCGEQQHAGRCRQSRENERGSAKSLAKAIRVPRVVSPYQLGGVHARYGHPQEVDEESGAYGESEGGCLRFGGEPADRQNPGPVGHELSEAYLAEDPAFRQRLSDASGADIAERGGEFPPPPPAVEQLGQSLQGAERRDRASGHDEQRHRDRGRVDPVPVERRRVERYQRDRRDSAHLERRRDRCPVDGLVQSGEHARPGECGYGEKRYPGDRRRIGERGDRESGERHSQRYRAGHGEGVRDVAPSLRLARRALAGQGPDQAGVVADLGEHGEADGDDDGDREATVAVRSEDPCERDVEGVPTARRHGLGKDGRDQLRGRTPRARRTVDTRFDRDLARGVRPPHRDQLARAKNRRRSGANFVIVRRHRGMNGLSRKKVSVSHNAGKRLSSFVA